MHLAAHGAAELDVDKAVASFSPPPNVVDLLRQGHKAAAGANMWKADVDTKVVEKAIVNLNAMVFAAQIRLDAKNDECEEFKAKYTETLDQINGDLARLGEELSNTARAILVHNGGIDTNILNNQQTKEELQREYLAYMEVRNADLIVLQERQTNMAVSAFILVFSACPDAPSAASMLQASANISDEGDGEGEGEDESLMAIHDVQTCVNATGSKDIRFGHPKIDSKAQELSTEAQEMLLRFISTEESKKGGRRVAEAASKMEAMALADVEVISEDLDDGDVDDAGNDDEEDEELHKAPWPCAQLDRVRFLARVRVAVGSVSVSAYSLQNVREHRDLAGRLCAEQPEDRLDAPVTNRGCYQVETCPEPGGPLDHGRRAGASELGPEIGRAHV